MFSWSNFLKKKLKYLNKFGSVRREKIELIRNQLLVRKFYCSSLILLIFFSPYMEFFCWQHIKTIGFQFNLDSQCNLTPTAIWRPMLNHWEDLKKKVKSLGYVAANYCSVTCWNDYIERLYREKKSPNELNEPSEFILLYI